MAPFATQVARYAAHNHRAMYKYRAVLCEFTIAHRAALAI